MKALIDLGFDVTHHLHVMDLPNAGLHHLKMMYHIETKVN
jgi:hypothetical protein